MRFGLAAAIFIYGCISYSTHLLANESEFSVEGFCVLSNSNFPDSHLKAYSKKLGTIPSDKVCRSFKQAADELTPKKWDYAGNRPYPGSVVKLTDRQVELLRKVRDESIKAH